MLSLQNLDNNSGQEEKGLTQGSDERVPFLQWPSWLAHDKAFTGYNIDEIRRMRALNNVSEKGKKRNLKEGRVYLTRDKRQYCLCDCSSLHKGDCLPSWELPERINSFPGHTTPLQSHLGVSQVWSGSLGERAMVQAQLASSALGWHRSLFVSLLSLASPLGALLAKVTKDKILHNEYIKIFLLVHGEQEDDGNEALEYRKGGKRKLVPKVTNMITMRSWVSISAGEPWEKKEKKRLGIMLPFI